MHAICQKFLNFGLVSIPVDIYSAVKEKELKFHLFHKKDKSPIRYARICQKDQKEIAWDEIIKGYEYRKGKYVFLEEKDFEEANLHTTNSIDILSFVDKDEIDPIFYEKFYYIVPSKKVEKPYFLLLDALEKTKKVAVATFVLHNRGHIAIIKPFSNGLILHQLRYLHEIRSLEVHPVKKHYSAKEINIAIKIIEESCKKFDPKQYKDTYFEDLQKIIEQKAKGKKHVPVGKKPKTTKVDEVPSLLKKSLKKRKSAA